MTKVGDVDPEETRLDGAIRNAEMKVFRAKQALEALQRQRAEYLARRPAKG